jgi:hypothetical protein
MMRMKTEQYLLLDPHFALADPVAKYWVISLHLTREAMT